MEKSSVLGGQTTVSLGVSAKTYATISDLV